MTTHTLLYRAAQARAVADAQCTMASLLIASRHATVGTIEPVIDEAADYLCAEQEALDELHDTGEWQEVPA